MIRCYMFNRIFSLADALYWMFSEQSAYVACPVCAAHGQRNLHLVWGSLAPAPGERIDTGMGANETATVDAVAV